MRRLPLAVFALALIWLSGAGLTAQDKKDPPPKAKGVLPTYWKMLGLSDEQKQKIYTVQGEHRAKIQALEQQIQDLKANERKEMEAVLTKDQKAQLRKILESKGPGDK